ncbi:FAS1-like dehydratase domain-containing protein [Sinorhizobium mexicanum]|uniref:FAS1-like dehydratase domain-containing protein n=1 Tax=Sinorhizobium mexicanum TaxID=375549 RepID=A0A859QSP2_9HYPH|nr:MaoC family dehydratase N-terminal domain-containing protein [Sinorhizobium mexicanum]MBP1888091.1 3-methylfumaryl-CoA hydratase [Sinorhizobium mexicanum]QLL65700.1 hypothetical protein FKV68_30915 [Sinorhizobium mexicanum]
MSEGREQFAEWIGRSIESTDRLCADSSAARMLASILPQCVPGGDADVMPALWHWLLFPQIVPLALNDVDGHPMRGGFLPPVDLPRRMWAGGAVSFHRDLCFGDEVTRKSTIADVVMKEGRSGPLCFVTVEHRLSVADRLVIEERQDIVYRGHETPRAPAGSVSPAPSMAWTEAVAPSPVQLFRYSAATSNSHRIHYDRSYATAEEGYPGLVVHGPLLATLLANLAERRTGNRLASFSFRARRPVFDIAPFLICGESGPDRVMLAARGPDGDDCMQAEATLRTPADGDR